MSKITIKKRAPKYLVGYKKPPKAHQFKPGKSGNPKGRPKGVPTLQEVWAKEAAKLVKVKQGDKVESVPKIAVVVRRVFAQALEGELAAARLIFQLTADPTPAEAPISEGVALPSDDVIQRDGQYQQRPTAGGSGRLQKCYLFVANL